MTQDAVPAAHTVESTPETVRSGYLDPAAEPVATVAPRDTVRYPNTWTHWGNEAVYGMTFADREPLRHLADPPAIRVVAAITQELRRSGDSWRIARRSVAQGAGQRH